MRHDTQPSPRQGKALHHVAQPPYRRFQHLARVADAFVDADGHAPGVFDALLPHRVVDGEVPLAPTLRASMRVQVEGNAVVWLARLCSADHVAVRAEHHAFLEAQLEGVHQLQRRSGMHVIGLDFVDDGSRVHAFGAP